jgi:hypothetical protein
MSIGLAQRRISEARKAYGVGRSVLSEPLTELHQHLDSVESNLFQGVRSRILRS